MTGCLWPKAEKTRSEIAGHIHLLDVGVDRDQESLAIGGGVVPGNIQAGVDLELSFPHYNGIGLFQVS